MLNENNLVQPTENFTFHINHENASKICNGIFSGSKLENGPSAMINIYINYLKLSPFLSTMTNNMHMTNNYDLF